MSSSTSPVWLITGCSSGFGAHLALIALKANHRVIATARNPQKDARIYEEIKSLGGVWMALDITALNAEVVKEILDIYGRVDVLVNNAGYSLLGAVEVMSEEECRLQLDVNFFGPLKLIQLLIPHMRERGEGTIVNITSVGGVDCLPSSCLYGSSKFALEGLSEGLSRELAPFNIRMLIVEPGAFRTNFLDAFVTPKASMPDTYTDTPVDLGLKRFESMSGKQKGNTEDGCKRIFEAVTGTGMFKDRKQYLRLILGTDAATRIGAKANSLKETLTELEDVWSSTDY